MTSYLDDSVQKYRGYNLNIDCDRSTSSAVMARTMHYSMTGSEMTGVTGFSFRVNDVRGRDSDSTLFEFKVTTIYDFNGVITQASKYNRLMFSVDEGELYGQFVVKEHNTTSGIYSPTLNGSSKFQLQFGKEYFYVEKYGQHNEGSWTSKFYAAVYSDAFGTLAQPNAHVEFIHSPTQNDYAGTNQTKFELKITDLSSDNDARIDIFVSQPYHFIDSEYDNAFGTAVNADVSDSVVNSVPLPDYDASHDNSTSVQPASPKYFNGMTIYDSSSQNVASIKLMDSDVIKEAIADLDNIISTVTDTGVAVPTITPPSISAITSSYGDGSIGSTDSTTESLPTAVNTTSSVFTYDFTEILGSTLERIKYTGTPSYPTFTSPSWSNVTLTVPTVSYTVSTLDLGTAFKALQPLADIFVNYVNAFPALINKVLENVTEVGQTIVNQLGPGLQDVIDGAVVNINDGIKFIINSLISLYNNYIDALDKFWTMVIRMITKVLTSVSEWLELAFEKAVEQINTYWNGTWKPYIKQHWKHVFTVDFNKVLDVIITALENVGVWDMVSFGGLKVGDALRSFVDTGGLGTYDVYVPHFLDPLLFTNATHVDNPGGQYFLSDAVKDLLTLGVMFMGIKILGPHGAKLMAKAIGVASSVRASLKNKAKWDRLFSDIENVQGAGVSDLITKLSSTIGLKLTF